MVRQIQIGIDKTTEAYEGNTDASDCSVFFPKGTDRPLEATEEENELFLQIALGDELAFRKLFHLYAPLFSRIIQRITKNEAIVADLLQDVFLKIWLKRDCLDTVVQPRRWAIQIVYHQSFNWLKHQRVQLVHRQNQMNQQGQTAKNGVEEFVYHLETTRLLQTVIADLPPQAQRVYRLNREQGLRISEIAQELKLSTQTVKNTLGRAMSIIRQKLEQNGVVVSLVFIYCFS